MDTEKRRNRICEILSSSSGPVSASSMASELHCSRQIIVGDIAILRASGHDIISTPRGYTIGSSSFPFIGIIACSHTKNRLLEELYTIVDYGGTVIDVTVEHAVYGQLQGMLNVSSRYDADRFMQTAEEEGSKPLSSLTGGIHLHHIGCKDKSTFEIIKDKLSEKGIAL